MWRLSPREAEKLIDAAIKEAIAKHTLEQAHFSTHDLLAAACVATGTHGIAPAVLHARVEETLRAGNFVALGHGRGGEERYATVAMYHAVKERALEVAKRLGERQTRAVSAWRIASASRRVGADASRRRRRDDRGPARPNRDLDLMPAQPSWNMCPYFLLGRLGVEELEVLPRPLHRHLGIRVKRVPAEHFLVERPGRWSRSSAPARRNHVRRSVRGKEFMIACAVWIVCPNRFLVARR